jgi:hypothetical protein
MKNVLQSALQGRLDDFYMNMPSRPMAGCGRGYGDAQIFFGGLPQVSEISMI